MVMTAYVAIEEIGNSEAYCENDLFPYAFDFFEEKKGAVGSANPMDFSSNEDEIAEEIDEELAEMELEDDELDEAEQRLYATRGAFFDSKEVHACLEAWLKYLDAHSSEPMSVAHYNVTGADLAADLRGLMPGIERALAEQRRLRIVVG
jgi:hypothetical protein